MDSAEEQIKNLNKNDPVTRNQIIIDHLPFVKSIVHRIALHLPANVEIEDLVNAGIIGLIEAIDHFDPTRENKFTTYAGFRIRGAVLSELRSRDFHTRTTRKKLRNMDKTYLELEHRLGREVEDDEVADEMGIDLDEFYQIKRMSCTSFLSLEETGISSQNEQPDLVDNLINANSDDPFAITGLKEIKKALSKAIDQLPEKEQMVISLYYYDELNMKEIGQVLDITESRVSQLRSRALIRLRSKLHEMRLTVYDDD